MKNQILTERPKGMDFNEYKTIRRDQTRDIRRYLKRGRLVYKAIELFVKDGIVIGQQKYPPFVGSAKLAKFI